MKARKSARKPNLAGRLATVSVTRNGLCIEIANVPALESGLVATALLRTFRTLTAKHDELVQDAGSVGGGDQILVSDDDEDVEARKVAGFTR